MFKTAEVLWKLLSGQRLKIFEDCSRKSLYFIDYIAIQNTDDRSGKMAQLVKCLPNEHEDLSLDSQNPHGMGFWPWQHKPIILAVQDGRQMQEDLGS